ncbi:hypothetical protein [Brevibacterium marinum]|uniref:Uncharacterized protein n=1 Tax=Brevibacterium marinum TaxID=418643 RepID=A0A846RSG7_9MICO|nr:hypothetical protein [Brevibacterium marinum]NJC57004.1 hypothetical protein [Brevibacterium marinum]
MANVFEQALDVGEPKRLLIFGAIAEAAASEQPRANWDGHSRRSHST